MKEWCLGFVILPGHVVLLKKSRTLHVGLWNGLGGKIEDGESAIEAMRREAKEESGLELNWKHVGYLRGDKDGDPWRVFVYAADGINRARELAEVTADYAPQALADTAYRVQYGELPDFHLAPHTKALVYLAQDRIRYPGSSLVQLLEIA